MHFTNQEPNKTALRMRAADQLRHRITALLDEADQLHAVSEASPEQDDLIARLREANTNLMLATFGAQDLQATAEASNRAKEEFLSTLAHELRNPLAAIVMANAVLGKVVEAHAILPKLHGILQRQTNHLTRLVDDLLDASRVSSGQISLQKIAMDFLDVIANAVEIVQPFIDARLQTLQLDIPDQPVVIDGDPGKLTQVFSNLLVNAAKFSAEREAIAIRVGVLDGHVAISVKDRGVGIASEVQPFIFDLFKQGPLAVERAQGGLGIGLSLVRSIVEMHGGTARVQSDGPGLGSEFIVTLPLSSTPVAPRNASALLNAAPQSRRILLVEDNPDASATLETYLTLEGHTVHCAVDGPAALALAQTHPFDIVLCDIGLPGMNGYDLIAHLRPLLTPAPCFIAVSGYNQLQDRLQAIDAGFNHYLVKPVAIELLLHLISLGTQH